MSESVEYKKVADMTGKNGERDLFAGKEVFVIGKDDYALDKAMELSAYARKVIVVYKDGDLDADEESIDRAKENPKIDFMPHTVIAELDDSRTVEEIVLANQKTKKITFHKADPKDKRMGVLVCEEKMW